MPISKNITQPTGAIATYHVVVATSEILVGPNHPVIGITEPLPHLFASVSSYLSEAAFTAGNEPLAGAKNVDITFILATPAPAPTSGQTVAQAVQAILENALIEQPNGMFSGGTIIP